MRFGHCRERKWPCLAQVAGGTSHSCQDRRGKPALCHSVSRDGLTWSKPNMQPAAAIDSREILGTRVYPSGDFFVLVYLASDSPNKAEIVTKISRDAVTWQRKGPPEFVLP